MPMAKVFVNFLTCAVYGCALLFDDNLELSFQRARPVATRLWN